MTTKSKIIIASIALLTSYAFGRWSAPEKVKIETKIVEVEKKTETSKTDTDRNKHKETTVTETTRPDGTKETTTKTVEDTQTDRKTNTSKTDDTTITESKSKEVTYSSSKVTVSALAGVNVLKGGLPDYGASLTKPILGPITVGAFAFQSGMVGCSLGLTF